MNDDPCTHLVLDVSNNSTNIANFITFLLNPLHFGKDIYFGFYLLYF